MPSCDVRLSVSLSVRLSRTFVYFVETSKHIFDYFQNLSQSISHTFLVFLTHHASWQYSDGDLTRASNAGGVGKNRDSRPISGFIAFCQRSDRQVLYTQLCRTVASW